MAYPVLTKKEIEIEDFVPYWWTELVFAFYQFRNKKQQVEKHSLTLSLFDLWF